MRATELMDSLSALVKIQQATFMWGPPGVGKTSLVDQICKRLNYDLILSHPVVEDPTDAKGMPWVTADGSMFQTLLQMAPHTKYMAPVQLAQFDRLMSDCIDRQLSAMTTDNRHLCTTEAHFIPFGELRRACEATKPTVWLLDDFGQSPVSVQAAYMQLVLGRRINGHVLSDHVTFIAASNRQEDRAGANKIITSLSSRFMHVDFDVSNDDWQNWARDNDISLDIRGLLRLRPDLLHSFDPSKGERSFPCPRTWEFASRVQAVAPQNMEFNLFKGCVGEPAAIQLMEFIKTKNNLPDLDLIIKDPKTITVPTDPAILWCIVGALTERAKKATDKVLTAIAQYAGRMSAEFATLLMRDTMAVNPAFASVKETLTWCEDNHHLFTKN